MAKQVLTLGLPSDRNAPLSTHEIALRTMAVRMAQIGIEITPQLITTLGRMLELWPEVEHEARQV